MRIPHVSEPTYVCNAIICILRKKSCCVEVGTLVRLPEHLTAWRRVILEKSIVAQLIVELLAFYGNRRSLTVWTAVSVRSRMYTVHTPHSVFKIQFNIILSSVCLPRDTVPFRFSDHQIYDRLAQVCHFSTCICIKVYSQSSLTSF